MNANENPYGTNPNLPNSDRENDSGSEGDLLEPDDILKERWEIVST